MERRPARTLALWCPDWPVTATGAELDAPVAVLEGEGARRMVAACSPAAREQGVRRGQRVRDAQRLCPRLLLIPRDEAGEARAFEAVADAAGQVAAAIEVVRPGLVVLDAGGPARYHGGEPRLATLLREAVAELEGPSGEQLGCGVGIADGIFAAVLAARRPGDSSAVAETGDGAAVIVGPGDSPAFLSPYPISALERPELAAILDRLGVRTLGTFAELPAADVADRFGADGALAHRLARGLDPRPPAARRPGEDLTARHAFEPPAEQDEPVVFAAKALADRLHADLAAAGLACVRLGVEITTASGRSCVRLWRHGDAAGGRLSGLAVAERVRWQLDGWRARFPQAADDGADRDRNAGAPGGSGIPSGKRAPCGSYGSGASTPERAFDPDFALPQFSGMESISAKLALPAKRLSSEHGRLSATASYRASVAVSDRRPGDADQLFCPRNRDQTPSEAARASDTAHAYGVAAHHDAPILADPVVLLRLVPDQLALDTGSQQPLWGREETPDRVGRAAEHVQALLGHAAVTRPRLAGARDPAGRVVTTPWGELPRPPGDPRAPWPGAVPPPAPALVPPEPYPAELLDPAGKPVGVSGRAQLSAEPAVLRVQGRGLRVTGWAGPWVYDERWWVPDGRRRRARLQCATDDGGAWLLVLEGGVWRVEGMHR